MEFNQEDSDIYRDEGIMNIKPWWSWIKNEWARVRNHNKNISIVHDFMPIKKGCQAKNHARNSRFFTKLDDLESSLTHLGVFSGRIII